jgi:hypothetical protein
MSLALFERDAVRDQPADVRAYVSPKRFAFRLGMGCSWCHFRDTHCRAWAG